MAPEKESSLPPPESTSRSTMDIRNLFTVKPASETSTKAASPEINQQEINHQAEPNTDVIDVENDGETVSTKEATLLSLQVPMNVFQYLQLASQQRWPTKMPFLQMKNVSIFFIVESPQSSTSGLGTESDKPIEELVSPLRREEKRNLV